jgi:hypothetical protein
MVCAGGKNGDWRLGRDRRDAAQFLVNGLCDDVDR